MEKQKDKMDMQEMMEIYKKVGTPGEPHKLLAKLEGSWTTRIQGLAGRQAGHGIDRHVRAKAGP